MNYELLTTNFPNLRNALNSTATPSKPPIVPKLSTISDLFMQNEPNFPKSQMNVTKVLTRDYGNISNCKLCENKANTKPNKANQSQFPRPPRRNKPNSNPNKPNFKRGHLLIDRMNQICCLYGFSVPFDSAKMAQNTDNWNLRKGSRKNLNLLKCKKLNSLSRLRPLTGTLFAYSNLQNFLYTFDKQ